METDVTQIAAALVATLAPFMPFLIEVGRASGQKLAEVIAENGGEAIWKKSQELWKKLKALFGDEPEVVSAATMVAIKPDNEARQTMLAEILATRLADNPKLALEIFDLLGGQEAVQQVVAERSSWVDSVLQRMEGLGTQSIQARDGSVIRGVRQIKR